MVIFQKAQNNISGRFAGPTYEYNRPQSCVDARVAQGLADEN